MVRTYLTRGLLVGLGAALLAVVFAKVVVEPQIAAAEKFEQTQARAAGEPEEQAVVSRAVQDTVGLGTGLVVAGAALGGLYALGFAFAYGRIVRARARVAAVLVALAGFTITFLVPFLKYPANPPSVGKPDTLDQRTVLYFMMMVFAAVAVAVAAAAHRRMVSQLGSWNAALTSSVVFVAVATLAYVVMPGVNEVPADFPGQVLWRFRVGALGTQIVLWLAIGVGFGALTERSEQQTGSRQRHLVDTT